MDIYIKLTSNIKHQDQLRTKRWKIFSADSQITQIFWTNKKVKIYLFILFGNLDFGIV